MAASISCRPLWHLKMLKEKSSNTKEKSPNTELYSQQKSFKSRSQITTWKYICVDSLRISYGVFFFNKVNILAKQKPDSVCPE